MANQTQYGFLSLKDRYGELVQNVGIRVVSDAVRLTLQVYNQQTQAMLNLLTRSTTEYQLRYRTSGMARLQPLDEYGRPRPIKAVGHYDVAWPLYNAGVAWGATWMERVKMTVQDANDQLDLLLTADTIWMRDKIFSALFANTAWQVDDDDHGTLTVQPLANGDATVYPYWSGSTFGATAQHFIAQAAAVADATNPFPVIRTNIKQHPENLGEVVALVPTNVSSTVQNLATFIDMPDANIRLGTGVNTIVGAPGGFDDLPGTWLGYETSKVWVREWPALPDNYIVALPTGGERPLAMREDENARLRGFFQNATREDHPFWEADYFRRAGFGAWNRVGATIYKVSGTPYTPPADYALPAL